MEKCAQKRFDKADCVKNAILDGEIVRLDEHGVSESGDRPKNRTSLIQFDLLWLGCLPPDGSTEAWRFLSSGTCCPVTHSLSLREAENCDGI